MSQKTKINRYLNPQALERLLLLIATLLKYPGIGCRDEELQLDGTYKDLKKPQVSAPHRNHHNALQLVQTALRNLAQEIGINLPENYPAIPTIRKDLELLRDYQILEQRMYRWGYYLGTGVMDKYQLKAAFNALESQAIYQGDPQLRQIYYTLKLRLRGFEFEGEQDFFYPVRQHLNRAINHTDPEEMMSKGEYRHTLFHQINLLEQAIIQGQAIEISRSVDLYGNNKIGLMSVFPLQLIYYDIAWYLLYENASDRYAPRQGRDRTLAIGRVNRFKNHLEILTPGGRGIAAQKQSLQNAHQLLNNGWGLNLGDGQQQQLELQGKLEFIEIKVRFFPPVSNFIEEGELRHPQQKIRKGKLDFTTGKPTYLDYLIKLPPRSLEEFSFWVNRYSDKAVVLSPPQLVAKHHQSALNLVRQYQ
ncbi:hypothetical protein Sta7437_0455 [Stanieria cyanosphaera PCC 7437]|uniref:Uncharacterized protein n=1 Tax=Stanieria cyanosphaera (strain ATCC 29371 / PCC 7437) TaxID=111780 RepID=K9XPQ9_STAC7|nr:WYL domain-containing protein [Stanieria cyanosphaera]AFZ34064.1 hypothetical protein Sta7437_0455 [Stanieria cyanosphaera PCC 7437]